MQQEPLPKQTYSGPKDAVLVTDADSPTGQLVVLSLILARKRVRALVRDAKEAKASFGPYVEPIVGEVKDRESVEKAMGEGVRAVIVTTRVGSVVDVARRAGVEHIVLLSQVRSFRGVRSVYVFLLPSHLLFAKVNRWALVS